MVFARSVDFCSIVKTEFKGKRSGFFLFKEKSERKKKANSSGVKRIGGVLIISLSLRGGLLWRISCNMTGRK